MSARARTTAAAALAGLFALLVACSLPNVGLWSGKGVADTGLYGQYGDRILRGDVPYRDFYIEFPPGALPALALPDIVDGHYVAAFHAFQLLCAAACIVLLAWTLSGAGASRARLFGAVVLAGLAPAALGAITLNAFDFWPAALTVAAVALVVNRHERAGLAFLGLATAAKIFPAALLPLLLAHVWRRAAAAREPGGGGSSGRRAAVRALAAYVVAGAVVTLPFLAVAPGGLGFSLRTQLERGLQVESLAASLIVTLHHLGATTVEVVVGRPYSLDLAGGLPDAVAALTTVLSVVAVLAALLAWWRGDPSIERLLLAVATTVTGLVAFGRVLSPQYLVWLIPLVAMTAPRRAGAAWALLALSLGLTQVWFPSRFFEVVELQGAGWVVLARNLVLAGAYVALLAPLVRGAGGARAAFRLPGRQGPSRAATTA